jgi:hypothetical protein
MTLIDFIERSPSRGTGRSRRSGRQVEEQPLTSLLVAFGVGLISGRLLGR